MRGNRVLLAGLIALTCVLAPARDSWAGPQKDAVCQGSCGGGCGPCPGEGGRSYSGGGSYPAWGGATANCMAKAEQCRDFFCAISQIVIGLPISLLMDAPYYAGKGLGYGLYYGGKGLGKGLYYGGRGLGKGVVYTGRAIGRGLAYPFNRPPKPILPPTTWEQYKHDVLKYQKRLAKANKANKENQRWCAKNVPLEISPNRARWEGLCNAGDAVSRASLPKEVIVAADIPVPAAPVVAAAIGADTRPIAAAPAAAEQTPAASGATEVLPPPTAKPDDGSTSSELAPAAPAGAPIPTLAQPAAVDAPAPAQPPDTAQQQVVQTGVAPDKAGLNESSNSISVGDGAPASPPPTASFIGGDTPVLLSKGSAPNFPASFGTPEQIGATLAPDIPPANSEAYAYLSRAAEFVAKRGLDRTREVVTKTAKRAVSAEFGPAVVLINMYNLPETILPKIMKMAKGDLSIEEGDMLTLESVNVLYNFGAAPNKVLAKIIEKRDAMKGVFAYGADEVSDKLSVALGKGIAGLTGEMHANARYPQLPNLKGSTAGRVDAIFHQNLKDLTTKDVRLTASIAEEWRKEVAGANRAIFSEENTREHP